MATDTSLPVGTSSAVGFAQSASRRNLRAVGVVSRRELIRLRRMPTRMIAGMAQPLLFLFVLGAGLKNLVGSRGLPPGTSYQVYIFPGVIAMSVITSTLFSAIAIVYDREFGFMREMLVAPVSRFALVVGKASGGASVAIAQGVLLIAIAPIIGVHLGVVRVLEMLLALLLLAFALTAFGIVIASRVGRIESFQMIMALFMQPMIFLSGAMYPLKKLPGWLAVLCRLNPATYAVDLARRALLGNQFALTWGHTVVPMWVDAVVVLVLGSAMLALATHSYAKVE